MEKEIELTQHIIGNESQYTEKELRERAKKAARLSSIAENNGNPLLFKDLGFVIKAPENIRIKETIRKGMSEEELKTLKTLVSRLYPFINAPTFFDTFNKNHRKIIDDKIKRGTRVEWEGKNIGRLNEEDSKYYKSNRMNISRCLSVIGYFSTISGLIKDMDIKEKLSEIIGKVPDVFKEGQEETREYNLLTNEEKENATKSLAKLAVEVVGLMEEK